MAEALVTFFLQKLSTLVTEEATLLLGVDEEVRLLQNELEWISLFIRGTDIKRRSDPKVKLWVKQLREITFHAEDVIDEFMLKVDQQRRRPGGFTRSMVGCVSSVNTLPLLHELGNKIKVINTMAEKISANQSKYCIEDLEFKGDYQQASLLTERKTTRRALTFDESSAFVVEDGAKQVKSLLMRKGNDRKQLIVVSIVGMGGLGKTTLAKKVYQSHDIKRYFHCFSMVSISQEYQMSEVITRIMLGLTQENSRKDLEKLNEGELSNKLREFLQGKKYLIVLDDVWDTQVWETLSRIFSNESNGSRILVTTRNKEIAMHADNSSSSNIYELRFLRPSESWKLFLSKTFSVGEGGLDGNSSSETSRCPADLEEVGQAMVEKCRGLPLAIVVLGGLLSSKNKELSTWSKMNSRLSWELTHGAISLSCYGILALSYYDLPYYLKPCFMYVGLFPEDYEIKATTLCRYWIAEGFIQPRGEEILEDVAEDYLKELIHRSLIQVGRLSFDGRVKTCRVHDLIRDMCIAEAKEDHFSQVCTSSGSFLKSNNVRRLVIQGSGVKVELFTSQFRYTPCLRSLIYYGMFSSSRNCKSFWSSLSGGFRLLKVLDLEENFRVANAITVSSQLGELIHLRYLKLHNFNLKGTSFLSKLTHLRTLHLLGSYNAPPCYIWGLHQIRHLYIDDIAPPSLWNRMVSNDRHLWFGNLTNLHTLKVCAGDWLLYCGGWNTLGMLRKVKLWGRFLYSTEVLESIISVPNLQSLELDTGAEFPALVEFPRHRCLRKLVIRGKLSIGILFPPKLVKLSLKLSEWSGIQLMDVIGKLGNLKSLKLISDYSNFVENLIFLQGKFLQLQVLELVYLRSLTEVVVQEGALENLTHLVIERCPQLQTVPVGLEQLTMIQELKIRRMPPSFTAKLEVSVGEDWDKVKHIPSVKIILL